MPAPRYATIEDLDTYGIPSAALSSLTRAKLQKILDGAGALANTYLGDKYQLPLTGEVDVSITMAVCWIASWMALCTRGFNPDNPGDVVVRTSYEDGIKLLTRAANGQARMDVKQTNPESLQPNVLTNERRQYGDDGTGATDAPIISSLGNWGG